LIVASAYATDGKVSLKGAR